MTQVAFKRSGFPKNRVIGMAGVLDSARMRCFLAEALDVSVEDVTAFVLGGHGDTMVPLPRYSTCAGIPVTELLPKEQLDAIITERPTAARKSSDCSKPGRHFYAPSSARSRWRQSILERQKTHSAVRRLSRRRIRHQQFIRRRAVQTRQKRRRADYRNFL
jgi:malate dehydrogenase